MMQVPTLPPFVPSNVIPLYDPGIGQPSTPNLMTAPPMTGSPTPYQPGSFCFGLDKTICDSVPVGFQGTCSAIANFFCGVVVGIFLIVVLAVALNAILPPHPTVVPVPV